MDYGDELQRKRRVSANFFTTFWILESSQKWAQRINRPSTQRQKEKPHFTVNYSRVDNVV
jgi:hypothetical protein